MLLGTRQVQPRSLELREREKPQQEAAWAAPSSCRAPVPAQDAAKLPCISTSPLESRFQLPSYLCTLIWERKAPSIWHITLERWAGDFGCPSASPSHHQCLGDPRNLFYPLWRFLSSGHVYFFPLQFSPCQSSAVLSETPTLLFLNDGSILCVPFARTQRFTGHHLENASIKETASHLPAFASHQWDVSPSVTLKENDVTLTNIYGLQNQQQ